jgi:hypothetical protein
MGKIPIDNGFENNEYLLGENFKQFLESKLNKYIGDEKILVINNLLIIFKNIEGFVCDPDEDLTCFINKYFDSKFSDEIEIVTPMIQEMVLQYLNDQIYKYENDNKNLESLTIQESISNEVETALKDANLKLSCSLSLEQIKYLSQNNKELQTFIKILRFVAEIKKIPNLKNRPLKNEHILSNVNYEKVADEFKYTDRLTETRPIKKHGQKYLGNCTEFNLNGDGHRLIFRLFDIVAKEPVHDNTIYIQVLGDPDYLH